MRKIVSYIGIVVFLAMTSCKKSEERSCFKSIGQEAELYVMMNVAVDSLLLYDDLNYVIIPSENPRIVLRGGANLLQHITIDEADNKWTISNDNRCNFLRSFKHKIQAEIYVSTLSYIYYEGSESLSSSDTIHSNSLQVRIRDGAGSVGLTVNTDRIDCTVTYGFADFTLAGKTNQANLTCQTNSVCDTRELVVRDRLTVSSLTQGNMVVNADQTLLVARIFRDGNIYFTGNPQEIQLQQEGSGSVESLP